MMKKIPWKFLLFCLICVFLFLFLRVALNDELVVQRYTVSSGAVSRPHRYVHLSDLHSTMYGEGQEELAAMILGEKPEAVFMTGDMADEKRGYENCLILFETLKREAPELPLYYVTGNHERWAQWGDEINGIFEEAGVVPMADRQLDLGDGIRLTGIAELETYLNATVFLEILSQLDTDGEYFDILLSHRPEFADAYAQRGYELTLTGHAHGGQVRIPSLLNGLYAPNQGWFPDYAGGQFVFDGGQLIVSRGLMIDELPRVFNHPEVVVIDIVPEA